MGGGASRQHEGGGDRHSQRLQVYCPEDINAAIDSLGKGFRPYKELLKGIELIDRKDFMQEEKLLEWLKQRGVDNEDHRQKLAVLFR
jgi:hypothetical protein